MVLAGKVRKPTSYMILGKKLSQSAQALLDRLKALQHSGVTQPVRTQPIPPQGYIRAFVQNTLDQTPYTPRAVQQIRQVPAYFFGRTDASMQSDNQGGGFVPGEGIGVNVKSADPQTFRHEILHSQDDNTYRNSSIDGSIANSIGFGNQLRQFSPRDNWGITQDMSRSGLYHMTDPHTMDTEKFAYFGQNPNVMLAAQQLAQRYAQIYQPMSKNVNYSPLYPDPALMSAYLPRQIPQRTLGR